MTLPEKLEAAIVHSKPHLGEATWSQVAGFLTPASLSIMASVTVAWAVSHFFGVGEIADAVILVGGDIAYGGAAYSVGRNIYAFAVGAMHATSDADLDKAGKHFADAVALGGITIISALFFLRRPKVNRMFRPPRELELGYAPSGPGLRYSPVVREKMLPPNIAGTTSAYGDITLNAMVTGTEREVTLFHERMHQFLTPKFYFLRDIRVALAQTGYNRSYLLSYIEEALAEGYAQLRTGGNVVKAITFPVRGGYVTLANMGYEAAGLLLGPVNAAGFFFRVYVSSTNPQPQR